MEDEPIFEWDTAKINGLIADSQNGEYNPAKVELFSALCWLWGQYLTLRTMADHAGLIEHHYADIGGEDF